MDNPYYGYRSAASRTPLEWPGDKRIAFIVRLHLEYWQMTPPEGSLQDPRYVGEYGSFTPDYRTWSQREYGNRVGLFRLLEVLDRYPVRLTVPVNAACVYRHRPLIELLAQRQAEFVGHAAFANRLVSSAMAVDEERLLIARSLDALEGATGCRPRGWASQEAGQSLNTLSLLADAGIRYVMDWPNDDSPFAFANPDGLISIPNQPEWDDVQQLWLRRLPMHCYPEMVHDAFQVLAAEQGRVFVLSLHPWLIGMAHRIRYLDDALRRIFSEGSGDTAWFATAGEVADVVAGSAA